MAISNVVVVGRYQNLLTVDHDLGLPSREMSKLTKKVQDLPFVSKASHQDNSFRIDFDLYTSGNQIKKVESFIKEEIHRIGKATKILLTN